MGVLADQVAAIRANGALSEDEKRAQVYAVKCGGLLDVIANGSGPVQRFIGRPITFGGATFVVHAASVTATPPPRLVLDLEVTRDGSTRRTDVYLVNPPILTGATREENLAQVVQEILGLL